MKLITTKAEGYGPFTHALVTWTDGQGHPCVAYVNPDLYARHGLDAMNHPGWHEGQCPSPLSQGNLTSTPR